MGSGNDKPDIRPAIAGDVESYSDAESLASLLDSEHPPSGFAAEGVFEESISLTADGTAVRLPFNTDILSGDMEGCRPFPGVAVFTLNFTATNAEAAIICTN